MTLPQKVVNIESFNTESYYFYCSNNRDELECRGFVVVSTPESIMGQNVTSAEGEKGASDKALEQNYLLLLLQVIPFILIPPLPFCFLILLFPNLLS